MISKPTLNKPVEYTVQLKWLLSARFGGNVVQWHIQREYEKDLILS